MRSDANEPLVIGVSGSLNDDSVTRIAVERALEAAARRGARTELLDLREFDLPMLDPNGETPVDAARLVDRIDAADAVVLGTPMYNGSYSSPLKTAIDYSDPGSFEELPVGIVAVAGGQFPTRALDHLRAVASQLGALVSPQQVAIAESYRVDDELPGDVVDRLDGLGAELVGSATVRASEACRTVAMADD